MRKLSTYAFLVGLAALAGAGIANDGMAAEDSLAIGSAGQANPTMESRTMSSGLIIPPMDPARGRKLFASKGCVVCHSINGVGGEDAPPLDAETMPRPMNPFEFAARMWRGAEAMIYVQREELGDQIELTGDELADIIAFAHDPVEQKKFSKADLPPRILDLMSHMGAESEEHERDEHEIDTSND